MTVHELLGLPAEEKHVVSLCGGGGKTTLLYRLARESRRRVSTALFTTTHLFRPAAEDICLTAPLDRAACAAAWARGEIAASGRDLPAEGRFGPPAEEEMAWLCRNARAVYIEADGARRLPLKYPAAWEPVIRPETTHVVAVAGLSALDAPVDRALHRAALAREALGFDGETITEELMARVLWAGYGRFAPVFLLNQADTPELRARGEAVCARLRDLGAGRAAVASLENPSSGL